jgi:hypothetical protein
MLQFFSAKNWKIAANEQDSENSTCHGSACGKAHEAAAQKEEGRDQLELWFMALVNDGKWFRLLTLQPKADYEKYT